MTFTYDRLGRQKTVTDYVGNRTFSYSPASLELDTETITGLYNKTITRTYETTGVVGRNTGFTLGTDYSVSYDYEAATGRFASIGWNTGAKTGSAVYSYVPNSDLLSQLASSPQTLTTYTYDPNRNLKTQVKNQYGTAVISQYDYQYDALGRRTNLTTTGTSPWGTPNLQSGTSNYVSNNLNQYSEITSPQSPAPNTLSYDNDGNLTQMTEGSIGFKYTYDAENRLIAIEPRTPASGTTKVEFAYDYMGRRVEKKVYEFVAGDWQLVTENWFIYDGWNLIIESSVTGQQSPVVKSYIWGLDLSQTLQGAGGIGGLLAVVDSGETYHYFYDGNGNVAQLVKASDGSIAAHYEYDPYGNAIVKSGLLADNNLIRYSTKFFDNETGLGYWGFRYYHPQLGRWINRDPIEELGGINLYEFVDNDPINHFDYLGLLDSLTQKERLQIAESLLVFFAKCKQTNPKKNWDAGADVLLQQVIGSKWREILIDSAKQVKKGLGPVIDATGKYKKAQDILKVIYPEGVKGPMNIDVSEFKKGLGKASKSLDAIIIIASIKNAEAMTPADTMELFTKMFNFGKSYSNVPTIAPLLDLDSKMLGMIANGIRDIQDTLFAREAREMIGNGCLCTDLPYHGIIRDVSYALDQ